MMILVNLEISRIQTFLFASPRLKAMLGANSLLARTIRIGLTELAKKCGASADLQVAKNLPSESSEDPLSKAENMTEHMKDNPQDIYCDTGVLIRDGGHFRVTFQDKDQDKDKSKAEDFARKALDHIAANLPGLRVECRIDGDNQSDTVRNVYLPYGHPAWQVCQVMGDRPASDQNTKEVWVSENEQSLEKEGAKFRDDPTDIIGILEKSDIVRKMAGVSCSEQKSPESLSDIPTAGYLALIHADGNSVGKRFKEWNKIGAKKGIAQEVHAECFFHSMRVAVRTALCEALSEVFGKMPDIRYQLLMLGGDDLLLACSAEYAFPFIIAYAEKLANKPMVDGQPLTIGAGIVIAKDTFPFHRLHTVAEELASSAKRLYRAQPALGSVVDWHISTQSRIDDPLEERRTLYGSAPLVGIARPYAILSERTPIPSLQTLFKRAENSAPKGTLARSQLRDFQEIMHLGDTAQAELAWLETPKDLRDKLRQNGIADWKTHEEAGRVISIVGDFIDLFELAHSGRVSQGASA